MTSVAEPGGEAGNDTAAGVSGLSAAALASWGNADVERDSNRRPAGCDPVPGGFERRLSSGDLALERSFRAVSTPAHSQGGAAPSCGPPPASATSSKHAPRRASTAGASATSYAGRPPVPQAAGPAPVEQAERERQLSSSRSAPPLRPAAARGWPARRQPPAARSSGRPNSRRPARGAAWPSRRPGS
jgi:hypothetical protein